MRPLRISLFLLALSLLLLPNAVVAMSTYELLLNPAIGKYKEGIDFGVDASSGTTTITRQALSSYTTLWHDKDTEVGFTAIGELLTLGEYLTLPSTGDQLPDAFGMLNFGPSARHRFGNGWLLGGNAFAGSSSNKPFANYNTLEVTANASLLIPSKDSEGMWAFFLNYSSNCDFLRHIPIPGFGYAMNKSWGRGFIGVPAINMQFLPKSKVNFTLRYFPIIRIYSDVGWNPVRVARLAGYFQWDDDHYWRTGRVIEDRQIFLVEKTIGTSLWLKLQKCIDLKLSGGWRFNRYIFEGRSIVKDTDYNRINLDNTPFGGLDITIRI